MTASIRRVTVDPAPALPGHPRRATVSTWILRGLAAVALPTVWALTLIPVRDTWSEGVSLLMVLPVLVVAVAWGMAPGALAALAAAGAFDLFHTEPYGLPRIDRPADVAETCTLLVVGLVIGLLVDAARGARGASQVRRTELGAVGGVLRALAADAPDELIAQTRRGIADVLDAESVEWLPGGLPGELPALTADGTVRLVDRDPAQTVIATVDADELPALVAVPAGTAGVFAVTTASGTRTSLEQRRTAYTVAAATGRWLAR